MKLERWKLQMHRSRRAESPYRTLANQTALQPVAEWPAQAMWGRLASRTGQRPAAALPQAPHWHGTRQAMDRNLQLHLEMRLPRIASLHRGRHHRVLCQCFICSILSQFLSHHSRVKSSHGEECAEAPGTVPYGSNDRSAPAFQITSLPRPLFHARGDAFLHCDGSDAMT